MLRTLIIAAALLLGVAGPAAAEKYLNIQLKSGTVKIEFRPDLAPKHVAQITKLAKSGAYDGIAFHRVIDSFMAQTGDVRYGKPDADGNVSRRAGTGDSELPNIPAEFSKTERFERGTVGMARTTDPDSANSQFFIMFDREPYGRALDKKYTIWGQVVEGIEHVDNIKRGVGQSGAVTQPDVMIKVTVSDD